MFIHVPPRIIFGDTYAAPWESLIFPNFKDCIKTGFKKLARLPKRERTRSGLKSWCGLDTKGPDMRTMGLPGRMSLYLTQTTDCCNQKTSAQPSCLHEEERDRNCPTTYRSWRQTGRWLLPQMWQKQGCGHWSWCHWCCLQGREGISEQGRRDTSGRAKDGEHSRNQLMLMEQISWFRMVVPLPFTTMLDSLRESLWPSPPWLNMPVIVFFFFP